MKEKILSVVAFFATLLFVPIASIISSNVLIKSVDKGFKEAFEELDSARVCLLVDVDKTSDLYQKLGDACREIELIRLMGDFGLWLTGLTAALVMLIWVAGRIAGSNRKIVAAIFPLLVTSSLVFLSASILIQGGLAVFGLYELQKEFAGRWYPVLTGLVGLGAAAVAFLIIAATVKMKTRLKIVQRAVEVERTDQPLLWGLVDSVAQAAQAPVPKNVLIGLEPTFYATGADVFALSSEKIVTGDTLYLSLPLMRLLTENELMAVIGHELGHFKGEDISYTKRFAPVYRALGTAIDEVRSSEQIFSLPALTLLGFIHQVFERSEKRISREREFRADEVGASVGGANNLISALLKLSIHGVFWSDLRDKVVNHLDLGRPVSNISALYASAVSFDAAPQKASEMARERADSRVPHPTDSHPTLGQRMANLNVNEDIYQNTDFNLPTEPSSRLLNNLKEIEERLSVDEQKWLIGVGLASFECRKPTDTENPYGIARILQTTAAVLICSDGKVTASEITTAEALGEEMVPHFSGLEFREACLNPENLPEEDGLLEILKDVFNDNSKSLLVDFLTAIAKADGEIGEKEGSFINRINALIESNQS